MTEVLSIPVVFPKSLENVFVLFFHSTFRLVIHVGAFIATNCFPLVSVSGSCVIVTRLALYRVCDHENFMSFEIALSFCHALGILRYLFVLLVVVLWKQFSHQYVLVWGLKNFHNQRLSLSACFLFFVVCHLILLALGVQYKSSALCPCYRAASFPLMFPGMVASGFSVLFPCVAALGLLLFQ